MKQVADYLSRIDNSLKSGKISEEAYVDELEKKIDERIERAQERLNTFNRLVQDGEGRN